MYQILERLFEIEIYEILKIKEEKEVLFDNKTRFYV